MPKEKIKIIYITPSLLVGGAERFLVNLLKNINRERFDVSLVTLQAVNKSTEPWKKEISRLGIPMYEMKRNSKLGLVTWFKLYRLLKERKPNIVHTQLFAGDIFGRTAAHFAGVRKIVSGERNVNLDEGQIKKFLKKYTAKYVDVVVPITKAVKDYAVKYEGVDPKKTVVIPTAIDVERFSFAKRKYIAKEKVVIGSMGRLVEQKGFDHLIKALAKIREENFDCRIAGVGPLQTKLKSLVRECKLEGKVKFVGAVDAPQFFEKLDIFVLPSNWEGLGTVVLEAGANGLPVIVSKVDGLAEVVTDGKTGLVFEKGNANELAKKIKTLLANPKKRSQFGRAMRDYVKINYDIKKITKQYEQVYEDIINQ